jgi:hypothetical protein
VAVNRRANITLWDECLYRGDVIQMIRDQAADPPQESRGGVGEGAQAVDRPVARRDPFAALQPAHGEGVLVLDPLFHFLP